jgi:hypothetical protein
VDAKKILKKNLAILSGLNVYHPVRSRKQPHYRIGIRNFSVFHAVIGDVMEVRRVVYSNAILQMSWTGCSKQFFSILPVVDIPF